MKECQCGEEIPLARWELGERYRVCHRCGEQAARTERRSWTVVQEYQKGGYMFVTADAAARTLRETNQKGVRT
jgi:hypothetical protein